MEMIPNHFSPRLSDLDLRMVEVIPPGGNWKNIPLSIPSKRLDQIRESFRRGEGSRSTYYGRLRPDAPSYTINTYFGRPGNGCHIHYGQDRVLSQREAARLQSFPDTFRFLGTQGDIATQIGNAVPPLLGFQIARSFGEPGYFVDLFAGAGGLSLGFVWAGWKPLVANDIQARFLETYATNIHPTTVVGDLRDPVAQTDILNLTTKDRRTRDSQLLVVGGPPCQGFSTAGNRRSRHDERNQLFNDYRALVDAIKPDAFVFENVSGLLNMEGGQVFREITEILSQTVDSLDMWLLRAEEYGVPQRRTRVVLAGHRDGSVLEAPEPITAYPEGEACRSGRPVVCGVEDALADLPPLGPGEDGSELDYQGEPRNDYQRLMRGELEAKTFVDSLRRQRTVPAESQLALELA